MYCVIFSFRLKFTSERPFAIKRIRKRNVNKLFRQNVFVRFYPAARTSDENRAKIRPYIDDKDLYIVVPRMRPAGETRSPGRRVCDHQVVQTRKND